ncbi:aldose 1-epimerase [Thalassospira alkalitolerans]|uniref:aldose 1-epimerase n=1 Tax=Thalassospira alkalitolerans TaxID=1293890 RepID=UPI0030EF175E|tara:strand:+ start:183779 stop:184765 length:987 start_codon:yes stop_codon:yes gene_type:complete
MMGKQSEAEYLWNSGPFRVGIVPRGGAISRIDWVRPDGDGVINLLRPVDEFSLTSGNPSHLGCFPMVPFANRLGYAQFDFDGKTINVPANRAPDPHAIHGFGISAVWEIERPTIDTIRFSHKHDDPQTGFSYTAWQEITVANGSISIEIGVRHLGREPMPYGIGLHPWFPAGEDASVRFIAADCFGTDDGKLPTTRTVIDLGRDFSDGKMIRHNKGLDVHYSGWHGAVEMTWKDRQLSLLLEASDTLSNLQFYIPENGETFCVEPVSHVPNVHNRPELKKFGDVRVLGYNDTISGTMTLTPGLLARSDDSLVDDAEEPVGRRDYSLVD